MSILFPFFCSCQNTFCEAEIEQLYIRNSNYEYNCGLEELIIKDKETIDYICQELTKMNKINLLGTNYNSGYLSISKSKSDNIFFKKTITLIFTVKNGYVFKIQDGTYKNDNLSIYLINKLKIKNIYSEEFCK